MLKCNIYIFLTQFCAIQSFWFSLLPTLSQVKVSKAQLPAGISRLLLFEVVPDSLAKPGCGHIDRMWINVTFNHMRAKFQTLFSWLMLLLLDSPLQCSIKQLLVSAPTSKCSAVIGLKICTETCWSNCHLQDYCRVGVTHFEFVRQLKNTTGVPCFRRRRKEKPPHVIIEASESPSQVKFSKFIRGHVSQARIFWEVV